MAIKILYGFDTERPYGSMANSEDGKVEREKTFEFIPALNQLMDSYSAGRTFFILGDFLEQSLAKFGKEHLMQVFQPLNPLIEIGQHTYNHVIVAPIATRPDKTPIPQETLGRELKSTNNLLKKVFGLEKVDGLRTPLGYAKGLEDYPVVLDEIKHAELRYVSSNLRNKDWGINAPLIEDNLPRQPFVYFNGVIEIPSHGWQDTAFTGESKTKGTEGYPTTPEGIFGHYKGIFDEAYKLSKTTDKDVRVGMCMHPNIMRKYDENLEIIKRLLDYSSEEGFENSSYNSVLETA